MQIYVLYFFLAASCLIFGVQQASGEVGLYKYIDKRGVVHYTNVPADKRYRPISKSQGKFTFSTQSKKGYSRVFRRGKKRSRSSYDHHIEHAARLHRVDPMLIKAVIQAESNFNRYAKSPKGAQGLMQLMPRTAKYLKVKDPFDPWQNIYGGTKYLRELLDSFNGNLSLSIAAYNAGPTRVRKLNAVPRIPETVAYVGKVLRQYRDYKKGKKKGKRYALKKGKKKGKHYALRKTNIRVRQLVTIN
ncbi:MAG: DUF4124 domain-containing protein [Candidatus Electrothrix sp. AR3]|nr:DUF4124 domain-containing protein [Candidatus Electrothrix sp. AR3]